MYLGSIPVILMQRPNPIQMLAGLHDITFASCVRPLAIKHREDPQPNRRKVAAQSVHSVLGTTSNTLSMAPPQIN